MVAVIIAEGTETLSCANCAAALKLAKGFHLWDTDQNLPLCPDCAATAAPALVALVQLGTAEGLLDTARRETEQRRGVSNSFEAERRYHEAREQKRREG